MSSDVEMIGQRSHSPESVSTSVDALPPSPPRPPSDRRPLSASPSTDDATSDNAPHPSENLANGTFQVSETTINGEMKDAVRRPLSKEKKTKPSSSSGASPAKPASTATGAKPKSSKATAAAAAATAATTTTARSPSPSPPPPSRPPLQTIRLDIRLGGPDDYEVDIRSLSKDTGQRPPTPVPVKRDFTDDSEGDDEGDGKPKDKEKKRKRVCALHLHDPLFLQQRCFLIVHSQLLLVCTRLTHTFHFFLYRRRI